MEASGEQCQYKIIFKGVDFFLKHTAKVNGTPVCPCKKQKNSLGRKITDKLHSVFEWGNL